jgi:hypothetical protein
MTNPFQVTILSLILPLAVACASALGSPDAPYDDENAVEVVSAELGACTLLSRRFSPLEGTVDSLSCSGAPCTRSCSMLDPTQCSTRCFISQGLPAVSLDQSILRPECRMDPRSRVNAGYPSISPALCEARGACWDNRTRDPNFPWCYERLGVQPTCGNQTPGERINAGTPAITGEQCVISRNACFDDRIRNVPFCFNAVPNTP